MERVRAERLTCWNAPWGNALEIGYETRCAHIRDITFRDIDVLHCEYEGGGSGGVLTIHNGDRAVVSNVLYEDIRIEDAQQKLIDFKITLDRYSKDEQRGEVRDIRVRNVAVLEGPLSPSIIQGFTKNHPVGKVTIEGLTHHGRPVAHFVAAAMVIEHDHDVTRTSPGSADASRSGTARPRFWCFRQVPLLRQNPLSPEAAEVGRKQQSLPCSCDQFRRPSRTATTMSSTVHARSRVLRVGRPESAHRRPPWQDSRL